MTIGAARTRATGCRWAAVTLLVPVAMAALLGCGGGSGDTRTTASFHVGQVESCLRREARHLPNTRVTMQARELDALARRATGGAVAVLFDVSSATPGGQNRATMVVERTEKAATATLQRYRAVYKALGGNPNGLVERRANSVEAYQRPPSGPQRKLVNRCLARP